MRADTVVLPYAKMASTHPRQCIFFGTINPGESGYLTDATGNRRYWPVAVTSANIELIQSRRDQIWAEARQAFEAGEQWWLSAEEEALAAEQVAEREEYDVWEEILSEKLVGYETATTAAVLEMLGIPHERKDRKAELRVAKCLTKIGFDIKIGKDANRKSVRVWRRST